MVARAGRVLLDQLAAAEDSGTRLDVAALWAAVERIAPRVVVADAIDLVEELVPDDDGSADSAMRAALAGRYNTVRPFLTLLGESAAPCATRLSPGCPRSGTRTSTAWVATPSPPSRLQSCGRCATRTHAMARTTESSDVARKGIQARDV
jgi:hypothetical protein